jgi:hypothetical protein
MKARTDTIRLQKKIEEEEEDQYLRAEEKLVNNSEAELKLIEDQQDKKLR